MANSSQPHQFRDDSSGLHHLVEAATALTQLVSSVPHFNPKGKAVNICDGDVRQHVNFRSTPLASFDLPASSDVPIAPNGIVPPFPLESKSTKKATQSSCSREIFPQRLMRLLSDFTISDIITWLPHGKSFVILQPEILAENILPRYFPESASGANKAKSNSCKYPSFTRKLNRWGFRQVTRGPDSGAFHHKLFCRDQPELCLQMICQRSRRRKDTERNDSTNILPRSTPVSHYSEHNPRSVTDSDSVISIAQSSSSVTKASSIASAPSILDHGQMLSHGVYRTTSPAFSADRNTAIVSNNASPTPRTQISLPSNPDIQSSALDSIKFSQQAVSCFENTNASISSALLKQHLANKGVTASISGNFKLNDIMNTSSSPTFSHLQQQQNKPQKPVNLPQLMKDCIGLPVPNKPIISNSGQAADNKFSHMMPSCTTNVTQPYHKAGTTNGSTAEVSAVSSSESSNQVQGLSEEELRIANAKSMLYNAYLEALG
jgi:Heat shock transcription factor